MSSSSFATSMRMLLSSPSSLSAATGPLIVGSGIAAFSVFFVGKAPSPGLNTVCVIQPLCFAGLGAAGRGRRTGREAGLETRGGGKPDGSQAEASAGSEAGAGASSRGQRAWRSVVDRGQRAVSPACAPGVRGRPRPGERPARVRPGGVATLAGALGGTGPRTRRGAGRDSLHGPCRLFLVGAGSR